MANNNQGLKYKLSLSTKSLIYYLFHFPSFTFNMMYSLIWPLGFDIEIFSIFQKKLGSL
jgi:hypothetical protein